MFNINRQVNAAGLLAMVVAAIGLDKYRHNATASVVVSVRGAFRAFLSKGRTKYNKAEKEKNPNFKPISMYDYLRAICNKTEEGLTLSIDTPDLYDLGRALARAVGCSAPITEEDIIASITPLAEDYAKDNEHLSWSEIAPKDILETVEELAATAGGEV